MQKFLVLLFTPLCFGAPQEGFGDASQEEIAQIRAGTFLENSEPQYTFNFKVADEEEQTYIAQEESRAGESVTGSYSYVDPFGSLITVTYTAGPMGYQETRNVQENFVQIRASSGSSSLSSQTATSSGVSLTSSTGFSSRPQSSSITINRPSSGSSSSSTQSSFSQNNLQSDIVSAVVSQVQPLISQTVTSAVSGSRRPKPALVPAPLPISSSSSSSSNDIVAQIVSQISPLVSQTVNSAVSGATRNTNSNSRSRFATRPAPTRRVLAPVAAPAPLIQVLSPVPVTQLVQTVQSSSRNSGSVGDLFGDGKFNVKFNTPDFQIEY